MITPKKKVRIGDLLVQNEVITEDQLMTALGEQKKTGLKLGRILIELGYIDEDNLLNFLSQQLHIPFVELRNYQFDEELVRRLNENLARRYRAIVLDEHNGELLVGMADPIDIFGYDELVRALKQPVKQAVVRESDLLATLDIVYRRTEEISSIAEELEGELGDDVFDLANLTTAVDDSDAPVVRLLQSIFEDAVQARASDIHIEPDETVMRIRQRIDGVLQEQIVKEKRINNALVIKLKLMSSLDISEKRMPQDGRFNIKVKGRSIDVRLSTMPTQYGESVVMRLLDQTEGILSLDTIGMPKNILDRFRLLIRRPHGMVLVTGPTGSGKTTTLYGALSELNQPEVKIITAEDPVEYRLPRITQVQVNPTVHLDFATVLRSALRQDPDIILVGEMRDQETMEIGLRAAMTGHLVMSTLHTNDSVSSALRLIDMGAEPFLVSGSLNAVLAQRLIRKICTDCKQPYQPTERELGWLSTLDDGFLEQQDVTYYKGAGCYRCGKTGYRGRMGVYELLEMDADMSEAMRRDDPSAFNAAARRNPTYRPLELCALDYAKDGLTTLEEVFRISAALEDKPDVEETPVLELDA